MAQLRICSVCHKSHTYGTHPFASCIIMDPNFTLPPLTNLSNLSQIPLVSEGSSLRNQSKRMGWVTSDSPGAMSALTWIWRAEVIITNLRKGPVRPYFLWYQEGWGTTFGSWGSAYGLHFVPVPINRI